MVFHILKVILAAPVLAAYLSQRLRLIAFDGDWQVAEKGALWTDAGVDENCQRDLGAIGPYGDQRKFVWTNGTFALFSWKLVWTNGP